LTLALVRIDDRLVHGQVVVAWGRFLHLERFLLADDALAESGFERALVESSAGGLPVEILPVGQVAARVVAEAGRDGNAILLVRGPAAALAVARSVREAGGRLERVNLDGLHYAPGKEKALDYVYLDAADREALDALAREGVRVFAQDVPVSTPVEMPIAWTGRTP